MKTSFNVEEEVKIQAHIQDNNNSIHYYKIKKVTNIKNNKYLKTFEFMIINFKVLSL